MTFQIDCPCGLGHEVTAAQAGMEVNCRCGRELIMPSLGQLNRGITSPVSIRGGDDSSPAASPATDSVDTDDSEALPAADDSRQGKMTISHESVREISGYEIVGRDLSALRLTMFAVFLPILVALVAFVPLAAGLSGGEIGYAVVVSAVAAVAIPCMLGSMAARRIGHMRQILNEGPRVDGEIVEVWYSLPWPLTKTPRGALQYHFIYNGRSHLSSTTVFQSAATRGFSVGDEVTVAVDPDSPENSFIVELYLR